jgi:hypothetical protein
MFHSSKIHPNHFVQFKAFFNLSILPPPKGQNDEITTLPNIRKQHRLNENMKALEVDLTEEDHSILNSALPKTTMGSRY